MEINDILEKFNFKGELEECNVFGSGHINTTYLAKYIENGKEFYNDYCTVSALTHNVHTCMDLIKQSANIKYPERKINL